MFEIAASGIKASQTGINIVANNLANATTEGYHAQKVLLKPNSNSLGVQVAGIQSLISETLEYQMLVQEADTKAVSVELENMQYLENVLGEFSDGLSTSMQGFFESLSGLAGDPDDTTLYNDVIVSAETLINKFNTLATQIDSVKETLVQQAEEIINNANKLAEQIASLNQQIVSASAGDKATNDLEDLRWQAIYELNRLTGSTITKGENGMINVTVGNTSLVMGNSAQPFSVRQTAGAEGLVLDGVFQQGIETCSGQLGGIFSTYNNLLSGYETQIDTLASTFANEFNQIYSQGVGASGSFSQLAGWSMDSARLSEWEPPLDFTQDFYINVTFTDGSQERVAVDIEANDTLDTMALKIDSITGLQCSLTSDRRLIIQANPSENGAAFDLTAGVLDSVNTSAWTGGGTPQTQPPNVTVSGTYTGAENRVYQLEAVTTPPGGMNAIGTGTMSLNIYVGGVLVNTVNIGSGYEPGTVLEIDEGIRVIFSANGSGVGCVNDGESFEISALADSDPAGFFPAVGWNSMFAGNDAGSLALNSPLAGSSAASAKLSLYASRQANGNTLIQDMIDLGDQELGRLQSMSLTGYAKNIGVQLGIDIATLEARRENAEQLLMELQTQQQEVSGVDTNSETLKMLGYEHVFQAMSQYITTLSDMYRTLLNTV